MLKRGGERDIERAAVWFVKWWRGEGGLLSASAPVASSVPVNHTGPLRAGWGFDFEWSVNPGEVVSVQEKMEACIDSFLVSEAEDERDVSLTQERKIAWQQKLAKRLAKNNGRRQGR
jgi:mitochondrial GTPase 1